MSSSSLSTFLSTSLSTETLRRRGTVYLLLGNQCKKAVMPNQITSLITIRALFVRAFPDQLSLNYLEQPHVAVYFHDQAKDVFRELEDLSELRDKSILKVFETNEEGIPVRSGNEIHKQVESGASKFGIQPTSTLSATSSHGANQTTPEDVTASAKTPSAVTATGVSAPPPPSYAKVMSSSGTKIPSAAATIVTTTSPSSAHSLPSQHLNKSPSLGNIAVDHLNNKTMAFAPAASASTSTAPTATRASTLKKTSSSRGTSSMKQKSASMANIPLLFNNNNNYTTRSPAVIRPMTPSQLTIGTNFKSSLIGLKLKTEDLKTKIDNMKDIQTAYMKSIDTTLQQAAEMMLGAVKSSMEQPKDPSSSGQGDQVLRDLEEEHPVRLQRLQVNKFSRAFNNDMTKVSQELRDLEATVEEIRNKVINDHCRVNANSIETLALNLNTITEAYGELKKTFPVLQQRMRVVIQTEIQLAAMEEKYLDTEAANIDASMQRCKKLTGTLLTMKRLASVQQQNTL